MLWAITCLIYHDTVEAITREDSRLCSSQGVLAQVYSLRMSALSPSFSTGDILAQSLDKILSSYKLVIYCFFFLCLRIPIVFLNLVCLPTS